MNQWPLQSNKYNEEKYIFLYHGTTVVAFAGEA